MKRISKKHLLAAVGAALCMSITGASAQEAAPEALSEARVKLPSLELFANQLPILIRPGEARTVPISGAVYVTGFSGSVTLGPNGPKQTACPIFLNGDNPFVQFPVGPDSVRVGLNVWVPPETPPGTYNCALRYTAIHKILRVGDFSVGKGNQVNVPYTVRGRR
jgi:hypothetical protein